MSDSCGMMKPQLMTDADGHEFICYRPDDFKSMQDTRHRLEMRITDLESELKLTYGFVDNMAFENGELFAEVERLKEAQFTEEFRRKLENLVKSVSDRLQVAYNNAAPVCCERPNMIDGSCCGSPEPYWSESDKAILSELGEVHSHLSNLLAAAPPPPERTPNEDKNKAG